MKKILLALAAVAALPSAAMAAQATATAGALIVTPLTLTNTSDLYFGKIAANAKQSGLAVVAANGNFQCGAGLACLSSDRTAASFTVAGYADASYTISLPTSIQITNPNGASMTVSNFNGTKTGGTLANGQDSFAVGGVLNVGAAQDPGKYTGTFTVTANYQ